MATPHTEGPNALDIALGNRIRQRRKGLGVSQTTLAEAIGLTFQQVQKYERGFNRVSFSRLVDIAHALDCSRAFRSQDGGQRQFVQSAAMVGVDEVHARRGQLDEDLARLGLGRGLVSIMERVDTTRLFDKYGFHMVRIFLFRCTVPAYKSR